MQEVKNFSSGVLSGGGSIQKIQEREAGRELEAQEKELRGLEEKRLAEAVERRNRQREQRALEIAEQARIRQAAEEERNRQKSEKDSQEEEQRLKVVAQREAARLEKQNDLEKRLAAKKEQALAKQAADEATALLAKQAAAQKKALEEEARKQRELEREAAQEAMRKTQAAALLDELSKEPKAQEAPKTSAPQKETLKEAQEPEGLEEPVLTAVKGEVHIPAAMPAMEPTPEPQSAYDLSELMPAPAVLTTEMQSDQPVEQESAMELMERLTKAPERKDDLKEPNSPRSENRFQKIINANRELSKENEILKEKIEKLLDEVHHYKIDDELVDKITTTSDSAKKQIAKVVPKITLEDHLQPEPFSIVNEAKKEMLNYLSTRQDEVDHFHKSALFLKYIQDPFYMNMFVQNNQVSQWWPVIDSIYNSIELPTPDWSKVKTSVYQPKMAPQPIRARTATLGAPVASSDQPMDRIAQHLGNMGI